MILPMKIWYMALLKKDKDETFLSGCVSIHCLVQTVLTHCPYGQGKSCISLSGTFGLILLKRGSHFIVLLEPRCHYSRHICAKFQVASINHVIGTWGVTFFSSVWTLGSIVLHAYAHLPIHWDNSAWSSRRHPSKFTCHFQEELFICFFIILGQLHTTKTPATCFIILRKYYINCQSFAIACIQHYTPQFTEKKPKPI